MYAGQTVEAGPVRPMLDDAAHPYTRALLACHPDRSDALTGIPGLVPSPLAPPPGCRFTPRCGDVATPFAAPASLAARPSRRRRAPRCAACNTHERGAPILEAREVVVLLGGQQAASCGTTVPPVQAVRR